MRSRSNVNFLKNLDFFPSSERFLEDKGFEGGRSSILNLFTTFDLLLPQELVLADDDCLGVGSFSTLNSFEGVFESVGLFFNLFIAADLLLRQEGALEDDCLGVGVLFVVNLSEDLLVGFGVDLSSVLNLLTTLDSFLWRERVLSHDEPFEGVLEGGRRFSVSFSSNVNLFDWLLSQEDLLEDDWLGVGFFFTINSVEGLSECDPFNPDLSSIIDFFIALDLLSS